MHQNTTCRLFWLELIQEFRGRLVRYTTARSVISLSFSSTILRLFLTMKCGSLVFLAASYRARERIVADDFTERTYPCICVTHTRALNPGICLTGRLIGDCGRDEARWGTLSETMAASARRWLHYASRCEAHFVEVCLTNEPHDAHNLR